MKTQILILATKQKPALQQVIPESLIEVAGKKESTK